jgi:hypothetical protein
MLERFSRWEDRAEYWTVSDIDMGRRKSRSLRMDGRMDELVGRRCLSWHPLLKRKPF